MREVYVMTINLQLMRLKSEADKSSKESIALARIATEPLKIPATNFTQISTNAVQLETNVALRWGLSLDSFTGILQCEKLS